MKPACCIFGMGLSAMAGVKRALRGESSPAFKSKGGWLKQGSMVDATMIHAPSSTKHQRGPRDPEMHATRKGQPVYFGMKAPMGVEAHSGLVPPVLGTAAHISEVTVADPWLHGQAQMVHADAGDQGVAQRPEHHKRPVDWQVRRHRIGVRPGQEEAMLRAHRLKERAKAAIRAKVEQAFRTVKCPFGFTQVRYKA